MITARRRSGRPRALTEESIAAAVVEHGFADLRVSDVAERLGVNTATLYRYVSSQGALANLGIYRLTAQYDWPELSGDDWRGYLRAIAEGVWAIAREHPGLAGFVALTLAPGAPTLGTITMVVNGLEDLGWTAELASRVVRMTVNVPLEISRQLDLLEMDEEVAADFRSGWRLAGGAPAFTGEDEGRAEYRARLDLILDGVAAQLAAQ